MSINCLRLNKMLYIKSNKIQLHLKPREIIPMVILGLTVMQETIKNQ